MKIKSRGHGNKAAQRKRYRKRMQDRPKRQDDLYELIDGNLTHYPVAYCTRYHGWLTEGLICTHRCRSERCTRLVWGVNEDD